MAIQKLVLCLTSLFVLYANRADCAPQGFANFGWPAQQDYTPRLPVQAFTPTETVLDPAPAMPGLWSPPVPAASAPATKQTVMAVQPRKLNKQASLSESRLLKGAASRFANPETIISGEQVTTEKPVVDANTDVNKPISMVESVVVPEKTVQLAKVPLKVGPREKLVKETDEQRLLGLIPAGVAAFGAALGRDGCRLKAACLAGTLIPSSLQGREMMLLAAETLVPAEWKEVFQAAKSSMIQKQDCSAFTCF